MITINGTIPAKTLAIYQSKNPQGNPGEGTAEIPMGTENFDGNRKPKASVLSKYLEKMDGFHWGLFGSPLVARLPDGTLKIYDGGHRVAMLQLLYPDRKTFPGTIIDVNNEAEISRLFHRVNGSAASFVNPETRFINEVLGEEKDIDKYVDVLRESQVTVYESEHNYVPNGPFDVAPKWKINVSPLKEMTNSNSDDAIWAIKLYTNAWGQHTGNADVGIAITGQIVKALHLIKSVYSIELSDPKLLAEFEHWFKSSVQLLPAKDGWMFNEHKHDRQELRHYGTAYGITQRFLSWARNQTWGSKAPKVEKIKNLYHSYDEKKQKQKKDKNIATA